MEPDVQISFEDDGRVHFCNCDQLLVRTAIYCTLSTSIASYSGKSFLRTYELGVSFLAAQASVSSEQFIRSVSETGLPPDQRMGDRYPHRQCIPLFALWKSCHLNHSGGPCRGLKQILSEDFAIRGVCRLHRIPAACQLPRQLNAFRAP